MAVNAPQDASEITGLVHKVIKRVMLCMAMADGRADASEAAQIAEIYEELTGTRLSVDEVQKLADTHGHDFETVLNWLADVRPALTEDGKQLVITAALLVIGADGELAPGEMEMMSEIGVALDLPPKQFKAMVKSALDA